MWSGTYWPTAYWADNYWSKDGADPPPIVGQSPRASKYRLGDRVDWVNKLAAVVFFVGRGWL